MLSPNLILNLVNLNTSPSVVTVPAEAILKLCGEWSEPKFFRLFRLFFSSYLTKKHILTAKKSCGQNRCWRSASAGPAVIHAFIIHSFIHSQIYYCCFCKGNIFEIIFVVFRYKFFPTCREMPQKSSISDE